MLRDPRHGRNAPRLVLEGLALSGLVFLAARLGLAVATLEVPVSPVWPATGVAVLGVRLRGRRALPFVALGIAASDTFALGGVLPAIVSGLAAAAEASLAVAVLDAIGRRRLFDPGGPLALLAAGCAGASVAATVSVTALALHGDILAEHLPDLWLTWFVGDVLGVLLVVPLALSLASRRDLAGRDRVAVARGAFVGASAVAATACFVFHDESGSDFLFLLFPALLLAHHQLGRLGGHLAVLAFTAAAILVTLEGAGPFQTGSVNRDLLFLQMFVATMSLTVLAIGVMDRVTSLRLPAFVLLAAWVVFGTTFLVFRRNARAADDLHFDRAVDRAARSVEARMATYEEALRGAVAFARAHREPIDEATFRDFASSLRLEARYPGINGLALIDAADPHRSPDAVTPLVAVDRGTLRVRRPEGIPVAAASPDVAYVLTFLEPGGTNRGAIGLDLAAEGTRREAADRACDTGLPVRTGTIRLATDPDGRPGFLVFAPIYERGVPLRNPEERRRALRGFVDASFIAASFYDNVLGANEEEVELFAFDGARIADASLVHGTRPFDETVRFEAIRTLELGQRTATIGFRRGAGYRSAIDNTALWIGAFGGLVPLLLASLVAMLQSVGRRAADLAAQQTQKLRENQDLLLAANRQALAASQAKSAFLANMSHELRTPISGILGMTRLLLDAPREPSEVEKLQAIHRSGEALLAVINDILDLTKVEAGKLAIESVPFSLRELLAEVVEAGRALALGKELVVGFDADTLRAPGYTGDPGRLRQVLLNLVSNAVKFTPSGRVDVLATEHDAPDGSALVRVVVRDTGIGISEDQRSRIFEPFAQGDRTTARRFGGTGLGLVISKQLVELMGGRVGFESTRGAGSTFWFELSLATTQEVVRPRVRSVIERAARSARVLVAEDNPVNRAVAVGMLRRMGHEVETAENGVAALAALRARHFDLVLMDCQMPEMDGYEATRRVRAGEAGDDRDVPIVAVTASAMLGDRAVCIAAGMDDYLTKPLAPRALAEIIGRLQRESPEAAPKRNVDDEPSAPDLPLLDPAMIAAIADHGGTAALGQAIEDFVARVPTGVDAMRKALATGDRASLERDANRIEASAAALGAVRIARNCAAIGSVAIGEAHLIAARIDQIETDFTRLAPLMRREDA